MELSEVYEACLDGKRVGLEGGESEEVIIDDGGVLRWKNGGMKVVVARETLYHWGIIAEPEEPRGPETEEFPVAIGAFGFLAVYWKGITQDLAHVLTHRNFVRLNYVLPNGQKVSFPDADDGVVPTKLWWNPKTKDFCLWPLFKDGYTVSVLPSSVTMLVDKEKVQNERGHDSRD